MSSPPSTADMMQQAIAQGPITEGYRADAPQVIGALNRLRATSELIRTLGDTDLTTRRVLMGILADTEQHASELADYLKSTAGLR